MSCKSNRRIGEIGMSSVRIISKSVGACEELTGKSMGESVAFIARVSNPGNQNNFLTSPKLLSYCMRSGHWSIFEQQFISMEIITSMAIGEQILRHTLRAQKFSGRYAKFEYGYEACEARSQDEKNRQNSNDDLEKEAKESWRILMKSNFEKCFSDYEQALSLGVCREQARLLLPASTRTTMYLSGSLRLWIHYVQARAFAKGGAQGEHQEVAQKVLAIILQEVPELTDYFETLQKQ